MGGRVRGLDRVARRAGRLLGGPVGHRVGRFLGGLVDHRDRDVVADQLDRRLGSDRLGSIDLLGLDLLRLDLARLDLLRLDVLRRDRLGRRGDGGVGQLVLAGRATGGAERRRREARLRWRIDSTIWSSSSASWPRVPTCRYMPGESTS
ncbi:hypothetical protein GCM10025862_15140 [Arsenicicoccus piscis]|uniref:Pentapeptide repeat-containing protein n=1 Tax=Arsenicicoccus piscis TaxID=673954 RepID=A0ABQ6HP97_9MICO|nr:hypothetical protein GCM10025862_15140 [Arsenicicoccus piscis]